MLRVINLFKRSRCRRCRRFKFINKCSCWCSYLDSKSHDHAKKNINQNSNSKSCKVISKLLLPEDLLFDIFSLVPLNSLINSTRYVCKSWAATIRSSDFAKVYQRNGRSKLGIYVENRMSKSSSYFLDIKDDMNRQFERIDLETPQTMGDLISTCDGILLLSNGCRENIVVNSILKCWLRIPLFPISHERMVLRDQFIIVRVPCTDKFKLFSKVIPMVSARKEAPFWEFSFKQPIYSGGNDLYWITNEEVIVMDVDKEIIVREYPFPPVLMRGRPPVKFLWMENRFSCIVYKDHFQKRYPIYILDFDSRKWSPYHEMGPFDYVAACGNQLDIMIEIFCLWINDQIIIRVAL
ncbi:putative F-box domain-containing protein [Medicago truncatula]|uniref:F-box-like protein n=1 Tax=Medicago truncatula TaxID=3880 RepID=G7K3A4_MEDTR|nr:F-box-like protein [Medicago truncatula]RHN57646.1 putative F-box domain-containing protein [Medicago truncatula]